MLLNLKINKNITALFLFLGLSANAFAQEASTPSAGDSYNSIRIILILIVLLLLWVISILAKTSQVASLSFIEKYKKKAADVSKIATVITLFFLSQSLFAQTVAAVAAEPMASGIFIPMDIYIIFFVIFIEILIVLYLQNSLKSFFAVKAKEVLTAGVVVPAKKKISLFVKLNQTVPIEDEDSLDMAHNYDGIRELDNKVPQWWMIGFYSMILFSIVYCYRFFISEGIPSQYTELAIENREADIKKALALKNETNNVDENNVAMLDVSGIKAGGEIYAKNCVACHGDKGQGNTIGPNLTDDHWMHKGSVKDVFYSVKYGWPEKGMKSWKEDFSPVQMAQVSSYVLSLKGSNPAGAKEAQGELYTEAGVESPATEGMPSDTTKTSK